ncbi:hypothetical protein [Streptomyces triculaminicus]|uniref:hypothetical protein n=1 Tax=Streptomyces triculaminicus TaxID=2816232 RepID=UPI001F5EFAE4|nr:hypothetical protein [Streptomyces triculaminicus]
MGLWSKILGTKHPDSDVAPRSATEARNALFAVNSPDVPYRVRRANPWEKADLTAEWWIPARSSSREKVERRLRIRMRLDPSGHEVRILQEQWTSAREGLSRSGGYSRG